MTAPNPFRQKLAREKLDKAFADGESTWVIHYSCESFYERPAGRSPRITSIALRKLDSAQTVSFSIHQTAERNGIPLGQIQNHYDDLENEMLTNFFQHLGSHRGMKYLHWNMRDANYGFQAIEHRFRVLGGEPFVVDDSQKIDLSRLFIDIYGVGYIGHPRLESLLKKNHIEPRDFLDGAQEAQAFENRDFGALHQSTLRKVDVLANLASRAHDRALKTSTTWWEMHGGRFRTALIWMSENRTFHLATGVASIAGLALAIWALFSSNGQ